MEEKQNEMKKKQTKTTHCWNNSKIQEKNRRERQHRYSNTQILDHWLGTGTSIKSGGLSQFL